MYTFVSVLRVFDALSGREVSDGQQLFQHKTEIEWVCISQCGLQNQRLLAFIDKNSDLYLSLIREKGHPVLLG